MHRSITPIARDGQVQRDAHHRRQCGPHHHGAPDDDNHAATRRAHHRGRPARPRGRGPHLGERYHGWALVGQGTCGQTTCADVLTTTDGGSVWHQIGSIAATLSDCVGCGTPGVSHIRFANDLDGYAFGPDLFVTTDGGVTWSQENGPYVAALEPAGGTVMRVAYTETGCPGPCDLTIQTAPAGS